MHMRVATSCCADPSTLPVWFITFGSSFLCLHNLILYAHDSFSTLSFSSPLLLSFIMCVCVCCEIYSEDSSATVPQACLQKNYGRSFSGSAKAGRGHSKVVTFGSVTEIQQPIDTSLSSEGEETELLRRLLSKATVAMPTIDLASQRSERERRYELGQIREKLRWL